MKSRSKIPNVSTIFVPTIHLSNFTSDSMPDRRFSNPAISSAASRAIPSGAPAAFQGGVGLREHDGHSGGTSLTV